MSSRGFQLQPEVEELLQAVAKDPGSTLLTAKRPALRRGYLETLERVSVRTAGLSSAERELLRVYREEVVFLLQQKGLALLLGTSPAGLAIDSRSSITGVNQVMSPERWNERARALPRRQDDRTGPGTDVMDACLGGGLLGAEDVIDVTLRIQPNNKDLQRKAICFHDRGQSYSALSLAGQILRTSAMESVRSFAWDVAAAANRELGRYGRSTELYRKASHTGAPRVIAMGSWLCLALQAGDLDETRAAVRFLDDRVDADNDALMEFSEAQISARHRGVWQPTPQAVDILARAGESVGQAAGRIFDAFL